MDRAAILRSRDISSWLEEEEILELGSEESLGSFFTTTSENRLQQGPVGPPETLSRLLSAALSRDGNGRYYSIAQDTPALPSRSLQRADGDRIMGMSLPTVPEEEEVEEPERNREMSLASFTDPGHELEHDPWQGV